MPFFPRRYVSRDETQPRRFYLYPETLDATEIVLEGGTVPNREGAIAGWHMFPWVGDSAELPSVTPELPAGWPENAEWQDMAPHPESGWLEEKYSASGDFRLCTARCRFGWAAALAVGTVGQPALFVIARIWFCKTQLEAVNAVVQSAIVGGILPAKKEAP